MFKIINRIHFVTDYEECGDGLRSLGNTITAIEVDRNNKIIRNYRPEIDVLRHYGNLINKYGSMVPKCITDIVSANRA